MKLSFKENSFDIVICTHVYEHVPNSKKLFDEIYRVLKPGGHFSISDVVLVGELPEKILNAAEMYAGCVAGAIQRTEYLEIIREAGFENISIQKNKIIVLPEEVLSKHLTAGEYEDYKKNNSGIFSITVFAEKPMNCCGPSCCS